MPALTSVKVLSLLLAAPAICINLDDHASLIQNALAPAAGVDEASEWRLKRTPEPTEPPRDPLEVKLGRALTPNEYRQWLKAHTQPAGPQKRINKPHVMSQEAYKQYQDKLGLKPTEAPAKELHNKTVRFAKEVAEVAQKTKASLEAALERSRAEADQKAEEHKAWAEEQKAERAKREELERHAANKVKERQEWMKNSAADRKAKILAKEQKEEEYIKEEEAKMEQKIRDENEAILEARQQSKELNAAKHWAEFHYVKAAIGDDCPKGWNPVLSLQSCKLAQKALGGVDETDMHVSNKNRPGGCFWHTYSSHVAFNSDYGRLSTEDERICEKKRAASSGELNKLYKKVVASEIEQKEASMSASDEDGPNFDLEAVKSW